MTPRSRPARLLLLAACAIVLAGTSCPVPGIGVTCSNSLEGFGFRATIPAEYTCTTVLPNAALLLSVRYRNAAGAIVSVVVAPAGQSSTPGSGVTTEDLGNATNAAGVTFMRTKVVIAALGNYSYVGVTTLPSGSVLGITVAGFSDDAALLTTLTSILDSVVLTG
jgi:hypothetical protein